MFDSSDLKMLRGFLLQCKLKFWSKPKSFQTKQLKVNYSVLPERYCPQLL